MSDSNGERKTNTAMSIRASHIPRRVADLLREQILSGQLADGQRLPKESDLRAELGVGRPAMREAMRILEAEGLVKVLRGNQGGAIARTPRTNHTAYALGLIMKARDVTTYDVAAAVRALEPICAGLCARRADRQTVVVAPLLQIQERALKQIPDVHAVTACLREFHETIVATCGNSALAIIMGALEALWSSHVKSPRWDEAPQRTEAQLRHSIDEHIAIIDMIRKGDEAGAQEAVRIHLSRVQTSATQANQDAAIDLLALRETLGL